MRGQENGHNDTRELRTLFLWPKWKCVESTKTVIELGGWERAGRGRALAPKEIIAIWRNEGQEAE